MITSPDRWIYLEDKDLPKEDIQYIRALDEAWNDDDRIMLGVSAVVVELNRGSDRHSCAQAFRDSALSVSP